MHFNLHRRQLQLKHRLCHDKNTNSPMYIKDINMIIKALLVCRSCSLYAFRGTMPTSSGDIHSWVMCTYKG